jgi:hypothetical protein
MSPRLRRFLLLLGGVAAYAAFTVLTPTRVWAGTMVAVCGVLLLWILWQLAKDPWPWRWPWRRV